MCGAQSGEGNENLGKRPPPPNTEEGADVKNIRGFGKERDAERRSEKRNAAMMGLKKAKSARGRGRREKNRRRGGDEVPIMS